jgi:hypothetical protein
MALLRQLSEQVLKRYKGTVNSEAKTKLKEVDLMINQLTHALLQAQVLDTYIADELDVPSCLIATYSANAVKEDSSRGYYYCDLPAYPIMLPRDMGIWEVYDAEDSRTLFIPITGNSRQYLSEMSTEYLEGKVGFRVERNKIIFNDNFDGDTDTLIEMKLLINDLDALSESDPYPIPPSMEDVLIETAFEKLLKKEKEIDEVIDNRDQS